MLGLFLCDVDLEQHVLNKTAGACPFVQFIQQFGAIHAMDKVCEDWTVITREEVFDLVRLQVTDEVPLYIGRQ